MSGDSFYQPAFPVSTMHAECGHQDGPGTWQFPGMTLRDYFAAKAMQELLSQEGYYKFDRVARDAYAMADEMLKAREA